MPLATLKLCQEGLYPHWIWLDIYTWEIGIDIPFSEGCKAEKRKKFQLWGRLWFLTMSQKDKEVFSGSVGALCTAHGSGAWRMHSHRASFGSSANGGGRDWAQSKSAKGIFSQDLILHPYQIWSLPVLWDCGLMLYFVIQALSINCQTPSTANTLAILSGNFWWNPEAWGHLHHGKGFFHLWVVTSTA